jgi:transcription elongation factor Elf1
MAKKVSKIIKEFIEGFEKRYCPHCGAEITSFVSIDTWWKGDNITMMCPSCGKKILMPRFCPPGGWAMVSVCCFFAVIIIMLFISIFGKYF